MHLPLTGIAHVNSITHEGKVVVVATDVDGKLWYTVRRDGFEASDKPLAPGQSAETPQNWEPFAALELPDENPGDASVATRERDTNHLMRSVYSGRAGAVAPVQLVSGMGHLYLFRQSRRNTLLVDRFVLDGLANKLVRKLEVRFTRSRKRYEPEQPAKDGGRIIFDALDFRDRNGQPFYEPTTELVLIGGLEHGWFSVVLLPTDELDRYRWHVFAYDKTKGGIELVSIGASGDGLFDLRDGRVAAVIRRRLHLAAAPIGAPAAAKYDVQREVQTQAGKQWLRSATRVMLAVPTADGATSIVDFGAAVDGTLARINPQQLPASIGPSEAKAVLLAPNTLERIRALGATHPAASGSITTFARSENDRVALTLQRAKGQPLADGAQIEIGRGEPIEGTHVARAAVVGRTSGPISGSAIRRLPTTPLDEALARGTRLVVNTGGTEWPIVLAERADVGVTVLQIAPAHIEAAAGTPVALADSTVSVGVLAQDSHGSDLKTLPLASGVARALDRGTRLVAGGGARKSSVVTLSADAPKGTTEIEIEPAQLALPANAALTRSDAFEIALQRDALGAWQEIPPDDAPLVADGMVTRISVAEGGRLRVHAINHGLVEGDQVRLSGAGDYVGTWPVLRIDDDHFQIDARWQGGLATNLRLERARRRALTFDGDGDYIADPSYRLNVADAQAGRTHELWFRTTQSRCTLLIYEYDLPPNAAGALGEDGLISLSANNRGTGWISAAYSGRLISAELSLGDGQWHHVAHTFGAAAQGQALYVDGKLVAQGGTTDLPAADYPGTLLIGESLRNEVLVGFRGEIADVRIWERIRTPGEIAAAMYGPLLGREAALLRYWPLGAIVEGAPRTVVDLSPSRRDAIVHGEVFATPVTLRSTLADGATAVTSYTNDSLVAVSAGVRYVETFEFRMKNGAGAGIRDLDQARGLFKFHYHGKRSHSADAWIALTDIPDENGYARTLDVSGPNEQGWFVATGEFKLTEDAPVTLMRSFGIADVQADRFETLELRKHSLRAIEAGITEELYDDRIEPTAATQVPDDLSARFMTLQDQESTLAAESSHWRRLIAQAEGKTDGNAQLAALQLEIDKADRARYEASAQYIVELRDPTNYWCRIGNPASTFARKTVSLRNAGGGMFGEPWLTNPPQPGTAQEQDSLWAFIPEDGTGYVRITTRSHFQDGALSEEDGTGANLRKFPLAAPHRARWRKVIADPSGRARIENASGRILVGKGDDGVGVKIEIPPADEQFHKKDDVDAQRWILTPTTERATQRIEQADRRRLDAEHFYKTKKDELSTLQAAMAAGKGRLASWKTYLATATAQLASVQQQLRTLSDSLLGQSAVPVKMSEAITDASGLETRFARVSFIDAASRITMSETADGNVQLAYFDRDGRMRFTRYDAAASTANATFEQWLPDKTRGCLDVGSGAALSIPRGIALGSEHTIEAWFEAPLAATTAWNTLIAGAADRHVTARNGRELGISTSGEGFRGCGFTLDRLQPGWHHLAAVARAVEDGATTAFYIDGVKVGDVMDAAVESARRAGDTDAKAQIEVDKLKKKLLRVTTPIEAIGNARDATVESEHFGRLAELRVWNLALTDEEIEINSKTELNGDEPGLLAWYPLSGDTADRVGNSAAVNRDGRALRRVCTAPIGHPGAWVMQMDGAGDAIAIADTTRLNEVGTIELWVKPALPRHAESDPEPATAWHSVLSIKRGATAQWQLDTRVAYVPDKNGGTVIEREWRAGTFAAATAAATTDPTSIARLPAGSAWTHVSITWSADRQSAAVQFFLRNAHAATINARSARFPASARLELGTAAAGTSPFRGSLAELRLWSDVRAAEALAGARHQRLRGSEPTLIGYWPLAVASASTSSATMLQGGDMVRPSQTPNLVSGGSHASLTNATVVLDHALPIVGDAVVANEYVTYGMDFATGNKTAMMRRFVVTPNGTGAVLLAQKRVELLELLWVGNAQFKPTLVGFMEGAPPVPSENLTVDPPSYNGAAAVALEVADEVRYGWSREQDAGLGLGLSVFVGTEKETLLGGWRAGFKGDIEFKYSFLNQTEVSASASATTLDRLELRGSPEESPHFPSLGRRFVPKNIGYALVVAALADVFVTRLRRSGRMLSYTLQAVEGIKPDVNTITFLINPAYIMSGSLDGLTGTLPTSERFFAEVPQMRAQYGAVFPASYYRLYDAYDRAAAIDKADAERATYFANFNSRLVDQTSLDRNIDVDDDEEAQGAKAKAEAEKLKGSRAQYEQGVHRAEVFDSWQRKMEDLQVRAGKHNIVNTYVWDSDGGTHAESQQFASTVEHTIGSSIDFNGKLGFDGNVAGLVLKKELTVQATFHVTQTMTKTLETSRTLSLNVDLSGVERQSVTDFKDRPYFPGEKVKRYRFMSFFLEGDTTHFDDFFAQVVDPEWLAGNSEGARALREIDRTKKNKSWRVMHRVTYVERPVLAGFGRDVRQIAGGSFYTELGPLQESVSRLEAENRLLQEKLDTLLTLVRRD